MKNYQSNLDIDYRIVDFEKTINTYLELCDYLKIRLDRGESNEFDVNPITKEEIFEKVGFFPKSVIVCFIPYLTKEKFTSDSNLSLHAISLDYHEVCKKILLEVSEHFALKKDEVYFQCDTGFFNERFYAKYSGLGKVGINQMIINEVYGSYGFIGLILSKRLLDEKITATKKCSNCMKCVATCPGKALTKDSFNSNLCLSYLTQKKELTENEKIIIKNNGIIYGCDNCQKVCPENKGKKYSNLEDFTVNLLYNIKLEDIKVLTNRTFKESYGNRNFAWRGKAVILRNLEILYGKNE